MSPWQRKLRRALGSVKDQTTIGLAKVVGAMAPELEVALVKVTSHDKAPFEEKHVQEVIFLISTSRAYAMACVSHLSRRLSRTQNWIVAVKALMLIHRLLREGDPFFEEELLRESRAGSHVLNLSGFLDDAGWEYSAFVRTYALFLDELLDFNASIRAFSTDAGRASSSSSSSFGRRSGSDTYGSMNEEHGSGCLNLAFKDMKPHELLERIPLVQRMLEHVLACHPAGAAKKDHLVQSALDLVVKDSFQFYGSVPDGLAIITDAFYEMENTDCTKAFEILTAAAKQAEALNTFYDLSRRIGWCPSSEYPFVQRIPEDHLETMEGFLRDILIRASVDKQEKGSKELRKPKALPAPPLPQVISAATQVSNVREQPMDLSLLDISNAAVSAEDHGKSFALAPFAETDAFSWQTYEKEEVSHASSRELVGVSNAAVSAEDHGKRFALAPFADTDAFSWQTYEKGEVSHASSRELVEERSGNDWELALLASTNQTPRPSSYVMAGGFDGLLVDRIHEQATYKERLALSVPLGIASSLTPPSSYVMAGGFDGLLVDRIHDQATYKERLALSAPLGIASSLTLAGNPSSLLALPASETPPGEDPFVASSSIPPPSYVQMSDMRQKHELLLQEQQLWDQYQRGGMQGQNGLAKIYDRGLNSALQSFLSTSLLH